MPTFHYVAKRGPADVVEGVLEAEHRSRVLEHLAGLGYVPVRVSEHAGAHPAVSPQHVSVVQAGAAATTAAARRGRIARRHLHVMTRQLASLMRSQVPMLRALHIVQEQCESPALRRLLGLVEDAVRQGQSLSDALQQHPAVFSPLMVSLLRASEVSGTLDTVFDQLAEQANHDEALSSKVRAALAYPICVGIVGIATVMILMTFVLPRLLRLFAHMGGTLPLPTRILMTLCRWLSGGLFWSILLAVIVALLLLWRQLRASIRPQLDRWLLRMPVVGALIHHLEFARFARAYALLLDRGVPILQATEVVIPVVKHHVMREELRRLPYGLKEGASLAACLKPLSLATPLIVNTIAVGEEGGRLGEALTEIAVFYERETERQLQILSSLLEPAMMVLVGGIVGFIVMAVLLPIFFMSFAVR